MNGVSPLLAAALPVPLGAVAGPLILLARARGESLAGAGPALGMAALLGASIGLVAIGPNLFGAFLAKSIGGGALLRLVMFALLACLGFWFVTGWIDRGLRIMGGIGLLGEPATLWTYFGVNLAICCLAAAMRSGTPAT